MARSDVRREEWRDVPRFEGELVASSNGRVARLIGFEYAGYEAVSVSTVFRGHPVLTGNLSRASESFTIPTHRIIALAFLGEPSEGKPDVNHKDGCKKHNAPENLEWCSKAENLAHARRLGLQRDALRKYSEVQYKKARELWATGNWTLLALATHLGMTVGGMHYAINKSQRGRSKPWQEAV